MQKRIDNAIFEDVSASAGAFNPPRGGGLRNRSRRLAPRGIAQASERARNAHAARPFGGTRGVRVPVSFFTFSPFRLVREEHACRASYDGPLARRHLSPSATREHPVAARL